MRLVRYLQSHDDKALESGKFEQLAVGHDAVTPRISDRSGLSGSVCGAWMQHYRKIEDRSVR